MQAQCDEGANCSITISGTDGYGDGWNGASIAIWQDTIFRGTFAVTGSSTTQTFPVCAGEVTFVWSTGTYDSECAFTITDSLGVQLFVCTNGSTLSGTFCTSVACPSCLPPVQLSALTTSDSAYLTWADNPDASGWLYQVTTASYPAGSWVFTTDSTIILSGLNPNTTYRLFACTLCGVDDTSAVVSLTFVTQCGDMVPPIVEDFENNGNMPACWTLWEHTSYTSYGYTSYYPVIYNYNSHGGTYHIEFYSDYGRKSIISPRVFLPANEVEAVFWANGNGAVLSVGYTTTDDSATAVFNLVETIALTDSWEMYTVSFEDLTITDSIYVVFRVASNMYYTYTHLDDITIRRRSNCPTVDSLHVTNTASGQITLAWGNTTATAWEIAYGPTGFDPDIDTTRVMVTTNPYTLTGLSDSLTYDFYVRSACGTERGYWSLPVTERPNVFNMSVAGMGPGVLYTCGMSVADPGGVAGDVETYVSSSVVIYPDDSTMTIGLRGNAILGGMTLKIYEGVGINGRLLADLTGTVFGVDVASSIGPLTLVLESSYYSAEGFLFNTYCSPLPTCTDVYNVSVSNITGNSAQVRWSYATFTTPEYFTIRVIDTASDNEIDFTAPDSVRVFNLTGLDQQTDYILIIQTSCDNGDTSNNVYSSFRTKCLSGGEILVGDPNTTSTDYRMPFYTYYYSLSQQLFDSSEVAGFDTIFGIKFYADTYGDQVRDIDIYVDTTDRTSFNQLSDLKPQTISQRKYTGSLSIVNGWTEITFPTPFAYNGHGSILLTIVDKTGNYGNSLYGQVHNTTNSRVLFGYDYNSPIDPTDSLCLTYLSSYNASIMFIRSNITFLTPCGDASCIPPSVSVMGVDSGSVTLSWVPGLNETDWSVEYRQAEDDDWQVHSYSTSFDTAVVSGLLPSTDYVFRITSLCGDTSASVIVNAKTRCTPNHTLPFFEDFESFYASSYESDMEPCWSRYTNYGSSYGTYYYPYVDNYTGYNSSSSMYFINDMGYYHSALLLPEMSANIDTLCLSFYMMGSYTSYYTYQALIGVMTDPEDYSTFVTVDTARFTSFDYDWQFFEIDLDGYTGNGKYICIKSDQSISGSFNIDDVKVSYINPCKRVFGAVASDATTNSVTLSFTDTNNVGSYMIVYGTADSLAGATDTIMTTTTQTVINGLATATQYHAWVRAICGGIVSDWVEFPAFATRCLTITLYDTTEYYTDFESGLGDCMAQERVTGNLDWVSTTSSYSYPAGAYSGGHMAQLYAEAYPGVSMLLLPGFDFSNVSRDAELTFWHAQVSSSGAQDRLQVLYRTNDNAEWVVLADYTQELTTWTQHYVALPNSMHATNYQIAFKGFANMGYGVKIDDLSVHVAPSCERPYDITVSNVTDNSAELTWTGNAATYTVNYRKSGSWSWRVATTSSPSIVLTDLTNLTNYEVRIKGDCSRYDHSSWSENVMFNTNACVIPSSSYNFDPTNNTPAMSDNAPANTYYSYTYSEVLVDSAYLAGMTDIMGFGFNPTNLNTRNSFEDCDIYFGTTTDTVLNYFKFDTTFVHVYHGSLNFAATGWQFFRLDTTYTYDGHSNLVVAINRHGGSTNWSDQPRFSGHVTGCVKNRSTYDYSMPINPSTANLLPAYSVMADTVAPDYAFLACAPYCNAPEIMFTSVTAEQATIGWTADGAEAEVSYRDASDEQWSDPVAVTGSVYTFTGLDHSTIYQLRVRQNCAADTLGYSNWSYATVTTDAVCAIPTEVIVTDITNAHATITWQASAGDSRWEVHVWGDGYEEYYRTRQTSVVVSGLQPGNHYHAAVRTLCGSDYQTVGDYSETFDFVTPVCGPVAGLHGQAYGNTVRLAWAPGNNNAGFWEIQYGRAGYTESEVIATIISPDTVFFLTNLVPNFEYGFRVRALCGAAWESDWTTPQLHITTGERTAIDDVAADFKCSIHPNPTTDVTTITVSGVEGPVTISVLDIHGRTVTTETLRCATDCEKTLDLTGLSQGAYFIRIVGDSVASVRKLVVK